jgi:hypothetical protein
MPGATVHTVAQRHGVNTSHLETSKNLGESDMI